MIAFDDNTGIPLDEWLRRVVALWRARHGVSARRFGVDALGDPGFVGKQARGRSLRLDTADRVLDWMGRPPLGLLLRSEVEAFLEVSGTKLSILGEEAVRNPSFVGLLNNPVQVAGGMDAHAAADTKSARLARERWTHRGSSRADQAIQRRINYSKRGGEPLEVDRCGPQAGLNIYVVETVPCRAPRSEEHQSCDRLRCKREPDAAMGRGQVERRGRRNISLGKPMRAGLWRKEMRRRHAPAGVRGS